MFTSSKIKRNKKLAKEYGWQPMWFGETGFNKDLIKKIKLFQNKCNIKTDGICGPETYRLILLKVLLEIKDKKH